MMKQWPNAEWNLADETGNITTWEKVGIAVLMDIRRELQKLNRLFQCPNFQAIPKKLDRIGRNTARKRKAKR
jgi:hypothetical protein